MDGFSRPSQQNQPIPPISQLPTQSAAAYRRLSVSPQNGQSLPLPLLPSQNSYSQYFIPDIFPRNLMVSPSQPYTVMAPQYPHFNYPPISGNNQFHAPPLNPSVVGTQTSIESNRALPGAQVPEWQPDHLVPSCPICGGSFGFFNRKHHCRKCGRVVCASCSNFKVLIPSSEVVRNPSEPTSNTPGDQVRDSYYGGNGRGPYLPTDPSSITFDTNQINYGHTWPERILPDVLSVSNGVEEVRACGDCKAATEQDFLNSGNTGIYTQGNQQAMLVSNRTEPTTDLWASPQASVAMNIFASVDGNSRRRRQSIQGGRSLPYTYNPEISAQPQTTSSVTEPNFATWSSNTNVSTVNLQALSPPLIQHSYQPTSITGSPGLVAPGGPIPRPHFAAAISRTPISLPPAMPPHVSSFDLYQQHLRQLEQSTRAHTRHIPVQQSSQHPQPRVQAPPTMPNHLKETDFCPICTRRLPAAHPETGDETEREKHIQECIRATESSVSPRSNQEVQRSSRMPENSSGSGTNVVDTTGSLRRVGGGRSGGRMVVYRATEIDTWDFDQEDESKRDGPQLAASDSCDMTGHTDRNGAESSRNDSSAGSYPNNNQRKQERTRKKAECVICFEEFEVGQSIARLECLCRYHKVCIRAWFDRKGNSECPVHAVRD